mgnify:CR=1 FL=1
MLYILIICYTPLKKEINMTKDEIIKDLSEKLEMEQQVKKHEVLINASYKETITKLEDQVRCIVQVNERLFVEKAHLKEKIKYLLLNEK